MKEFMLIGPTTALGYKCVFSLIKEGIIWIPPERPISPRTGKDYIRKTLGRFPFETEGKEYMEENAGWFFSIPQVHKHHLQLTNTYDPEKYHVLDNYEAINVNKWQDIPCDYDGVIAVPINGFLTQYNPDEWEIIDKVGDAKLNKKNLFWRLLVRRKQP